MSEIIGKWFDTRSKAQKRVDAERHRQKLLPFGEPQRLKILERLNGISSVKEKEMLMFDFLMIKENLLDKPELTIAETIQMHKSSHLAKLSSEDLRYFTRLLKVDLAMDASLDYVGKMQEEV